jgi:hypothetical protein
LFAALLVGQPESLDFFLSKNICLFTPIALFPQSHRETPASEHLQWMKNVAGSFPFVFMGVVFVLSRILLGSQGWPQT